MADGLPDPYGLIRRIKNKLSQDCAIRRSPFCEEIIAMRMQGINLSAIESWLIDQGPEHRIAASTISRLLKATNLEVKLPIAEEMAEKWGGRIDIDIQREIQGLILIQRDRISTLVRREQDEQETRPSYIDRRIRAEIEAQNEILTSLHTIRVDEERLGRVDEPELGETLQLTAEQEKALVQVLVGPEKVNLHELLGADLGEDLTGIADGSNIH